MKLNTHLGSEDLTAHMSPADIEAVKHGEKVSAYTRGVNVTVTGGSESPLDYHERTWSEPRFGESPAQHFQRINGGAN